MIARFMLRHAAVALIALVAFGLAWPAAAQTPAPQVSPASLLIAKQIVEMKGVKAMFGPLVRGVVVKTKDSVLQTNPMWAKDLDEIAASLLKEYQPRGEEIVDATARFYASHFTEAELKQILTFYQSPAGQKMIIEEPKALDESMIYAGNWGDSLSIDVMSKLRAEMKKRGHDL